MRVENLQNNLTQRRKDAEIRLAKMKLGALESNGTLFKQLFSNIRTNIHRQIVRVNVGEYRFRNFFVSFSCRCF